MKLRMLAVAATAGLVLASSAWAEGTVQQKTQVHMGGGIGALVNVFGGKATHEGIDSTIALKGNRKSTRHGDAGDIVDLSEEKVYHVDYARQTYSVVTFDELRKQYEESKARAAREAKNDKSDKNAKNDGPEYDVDFDVKSTGHKETINGFNTHQEIVTITVHEKGKKLEQSGGFVLTADMAMGARVAAMQEISDFDRRFFTKVYGGVAMADMQQMAALMATTPAFGKAMKAFADKRASFDGTPIRTALTFETVVGSEGQKGQTASNDEGSAASAMIGGLMNRMKKRKQESSANEAPGRSTLFDSTTELVSATNSASGDSVMLPATFKKR